MIKAKRHWTTGAILLAALWLGSCATSEENKEGLGGNNETLKIEGVGFATPESVIHDKARDYYLVSNINGGPDKKDGNGFISRVSAKGKLTDLKWISSGSGGAVLNAPKGMAIHDDLLYVADIDHLRVFDLKTGKPGGQHQLAGALFLNDVAVAADGTIYVSDTGLHRIWKIRLKPTFEAMAMAISAKDTATSSAQSSAAGEPKPLCASGAPPKTLQGKSWSPNGILLSGGHLVVVTFGTPGMLHIFPPNTVETCSGPSPLTMSFGGDQLDGIVSYCKDEAKKDCWWLISSWANKAVYAVKYTVTEAEVDITATSPPILKDLASPADIGIDHGRRRLLIPLFKENKVIIAPLPSTF